MSQFALSNKKMKNCNFENDEQYSDKPLRHIFLVAFSQRSSFKGAGEGDVSKYYQFANSERAVIKNIELGNKTSKTLGRRWKPFKAILLLN